MENNQKSKSKETQSKQKKNRKERRLHYQVYIQEQRNHHPKEEEDLEY
ncbi:hypothetical protein [Alteribacter populi]|nr:hypothetical protein [Alteribacter populi]